MECDVGVGSETIVKFTSEGTRVVWSKIVLVFVKGKIKITPETNHTVWEKAFERM